MAWKEQMVEQYGQEYILRQTAEESAELCQAALKVVRVMRDETPVKWQDAQNHLLEEIADVELMLDILKEHVLTFEARHRISEICAEKERRMHARLIEDE